MSDHATLAFGFASSLLYLGWAYAQSGTPEKHMTWALLFYATANIALLWPSLKRVL